MPILFAHGSQLVHLIRSTGLFFCLPSAGRVLCLASPTVVHLLYATHSYMTKNEYRHLSYLLELHNSILVFTLYTRRILDAILSLCSILLSLYFLIAFTLLILPKRSEFNLSFQVSFQVKFDPKKIFQCRCTIMVSLIHYTLRVIFYDQCIARSLFDSFSFQFSLLIHILY